MQTKSSSHCQEIFFQRKYSSGSDFSRRWRESGDSIRKNGMVQWSVAVGGPSSLSSSSKTGGTKFESFIAQNNQSWRSGTCGAGKSAERNTQKRTECFAVPSRNHHRSSFHTDLGRRSAGSSGRRSCGCSISERATSKETGKRKRNCHF